ncbi:uncharacterized protein LOC131215012 isoform X2 [Anopheles bellator]|uniref:uncharacterized protein LOC131215012 isoform X2 n=1 Tax=Anopheles bellator TaxID=139047 RepID=UPI00264A22AB|nr:uncharacterized protein LOC131215012 isoform X2 [Anopheles bellator]
MLCSVVALVLALATVQAVHYGCEPATTKADRACVLKDVQLLTDESVRNASFDADQPVLSMEGGQIPHFSLELARKLPTVQDLTLSAMAIRNVTIWSGLRHVTVNGSGLEAVDFEPGGVDHQLSSLVLTHNRLQAVPRFDGKFQRLRVLSLDGNLLQRVLLSDFANLTELHSLSLAANQLLSVELGDVPGGNGALLLKLRHLSLAGNRLVTLKFTGWHLDSLTTLDLSGNNLYLLEGELQDLGAALKRISYAGNEWSCDWLSKAQLYFEEQQRVTVSDRDEPARCERLSMRNLQSVCCFEPAEHDFSTDVFGAHWDELSGLQRRFDLLQYAFETETNTGKDRISDWQHQLREPFERATAVQAELESSLVHLKAAVKEEADRLGRLADTVKRSLADLQQSAEDLHRRHTRPTPSIDAIHQRSFGISIDLARTLVDRLRKAIRVYAGRTDQHESRLRSLGERAAQLRTLVTQLDTSNRALEQRIAPMEKIVDTAYRFVNADPASPMHVYS